MKNTISISVFFPSLNDAKILPDLIKKTHTILLEITDDFEIIVINDGSVDETEKVLSELQKKNNRLKVITHPKNLGYGASVISGFKNAKKEWIFYTDGDGQYDPKEIVKLIENMEGADVVNGYKLERKDSVLRRVIGFINNKIQHILYDIPISDVDCDFRLIKREFVKKISLVSHSGTICVELVVKLQLVGARFREVGVHHRARIYGKSEFFTFSNIVRTIWENITLYWMLR